MIIGEFGVRNIGFDPMNVISFGTQLIFAIRDSFRGDIENRNIDETIFQKIVNQRRIAPADIDYLPLLCQRWSG